MNRRQLLKTIFGTTILVSLPALSEASKISTRKLPKVHAVYGDESACEALAKVYDKTIRTTRAVDVLNVIELVENNQQARVLVITNENSLKSLWPLFGCVLKATKTEAGCQFEMRSLSSNGC